MFCRASLHPYPLHRESVSGRHSATFVAAVARSLHAGGDRFFHHPPAVFGQAQEAHQVYEGGGEIELAAKLAGGVVEGERVVVVVKAFPWKTSAFIQTCHPISKSPFYW